MSGDNDYFNRKKGVTLKIQPEQDKKEEEDHSSMPHLGGIRMRSSDSDEELRAIFQRNYPPPMLLPIKSGVSLNSAATSRHAPSYSVSLNGGEHQVNLSQTQLANKQLLEMPKDKHTEHKNQSRKTALGFPTKEGLKTIFGSDGEAPLITEVDIVSIDGNLVDRIFDCNNSDIAKYLPPSSSRRFEDIVGNASLNTHFPKLHQRKPEPAATVTAPSSPSSVPSPPIMREKPSFAIGSRLCCIASTSALSTSYQSATTSANRDLFYIYEEADTDCRDKNMLDKKRSTITTTTSPRFDPSYIYTKDNLIETKDNTEFEQAIRVNIKGAPDAVSTLGPASSRKSYFSLPHIFVSQVYTLLA